LINATNTPVRRKPDRPPGVVENFIIDTEERKGAGVCAILREIIKVHPGQSPHNPRGHSSSSARIGRRGARAIFCFCERGRESVRKTRSMESSRTLLMRAGRRFDLLGFAKEITKQQPSNPFALARCQWRTRTRVSTRVDLYLLQLLTAKPDGREDRLQPRRTRCGPLQVRRRVARTKKPSRSANVVVRGNNLGNVHHSSATRQGDRAYRKKAISINSGDATRGLVCLAYAEMGQAEGSGMSRQKGGEVPAAVEVC